MKTFDLLVLDGQGGDFTVMVVPGGTVDRLEVKATLLPGECWECRLSKAFEEIMGIDPFGQPGVFHLQAGAPENCKGFQVPGPGRVGKMIALRLN